MNTLKPLVIFAVLVGVCYGVYSRINHKSDSPPPEVSSSWADLSGPQIESGDGANHTAPSGFPGHPVGPGGSGFVPPMTMGSASGAPAAHLSGDPHGMAADPRFQAQPGGPGADMALAGGASGADNFAASGYSAAAPYGASGADAYGPAGSNNPPNTLGAYGGQSVDANDPYANPASGSSMGGGSFATAYDQAKRELDSGRLLEAHKQLSRFYDDPNLSEPEQVQLMELLDQLAGTVIYSTQHLMEAAYEVQPGETLESVAQKHSVPWQFLAKMNGIDDPNALRPGERLKVVRGPFSAVIDLDKHQLTLMLNGAYAGRFRVGVGRDYPPQVGQCFVNQKVIDPIYYGPGRTIQRGDPTNPLGRRWIGLSNHMGIHGTNDPQSIGQDNLPGSISLSERDIDDLFDILSEQSQVIVKGGQSAGPTDLNARGPAASAAAWR